VEGARQLVQLRRLTELTLVDARTSHEALKWAPGQPLLQLRIKSLEVDDGLPALGERRGLTLLDLNLTKVSEACVARPRKNLLHCQVER
jgi:hypothetical protein